jgi:hypothetical protein
MCPSVHRTRTIFGILGIQGHSISEKKNNLVSNWRRAASLRALKPRHAVYSALDLSSGSCGAVESDAKINKQPPRCCEHMSLILTLRRSRLDLAFRRLFPWLVLCDCRSLVVIVRVRSRFKVSRIHCCSRRVLSHLAICASSTNLPTTLKIEPYFLYHM